MITPSARITFRDMPLWVVFDHPTSRWVEIAHMCREIDVRTGRGARVRSRPLAYIRTGCMHIVVQCNGPGLATVEVNKTTLPENQDGLGGRGGPICSLGLCRPNGENAEACDTATPRTSLIP